MKKLKLWLLALLTGQLLVLWKKDSTFKKQVTKKQWRDKLKYIWEKLFAFNKDLFEEGRHAVESTDLKAEYESLKDKVIETKDSLEWLTKKKRQEIIDDIQIQYDLLVARAHKIEVDLDKKYGWKEKWEELKSLITKLQK